jgi:hypothetical protein
VIWTGQGKAKLEASGCREAHGQWLLLVADGATRRWWVRLAVAPWIGTRIWDRGTQIGSRFRGADRGGGGNVGADPQQGGRWGAKMKMRLHRRRSRRGRSQRVTVSQIEVKAE